MKDNKLMRKRNQTYVESALPAKVPQDLFTSKVWSMKEHVTFESTLLQTQMSSTRGTENHS